MATSVKPVAGKLTLDTVGHFTWDFGSRFHIQTAVGDFEWSDPDYTAGDNTIRPAKPYEQWLAERKVPFGRDKGTHSIRDYCGVGVKLP